MNALVFVLCVFAVSTLANENRSVSYPNVIANNCALLQGTWDFWGDGGVGQGRLYVENCKYVTFYWLNPACATVGPKYAPCVACANVSMGPIDKKVFAGPDFEINSFILPFSHNVDYFCTIAASTFTNGISRFDCATEPHNKEQVDDNEYSAHVKSHVTFNYRSATMDADLNRKNKLYSKNHPGWGMACREALVSPPGP